MQKLTHEDLRAAARAVDDALAKLVRAVKAADGQLGFYDADACGLAMLISLSRKAEAVIELARASVLHAPAAAVVARAGFELGVKVGWLLEPRDPFVRESRYLAWLESGEVHERRVAREVEDLGGDAAALRRSADQLAAFRTGVAAKLPHHVKPTKMPNMRELLKALREERRYVYYMHYSEYVHGSLGAMTHYMQHLGSAKTLEERADFSHWRGPLDLMWFAIWYAGGWVLHRARRDEDPEFVSEVERAEVVKAIARLGA